MPNKYALIIGIENYPEESGQNKVLYALNDCKAVADYFEKDAGFKIERPLLDEEATYSSMIRALDRLVHYIEPSDWVVLFYAGHGHYNEHGGYLVPYSYRKGKEFNEENCLSFDTINNRLQKIKPEKFLFLLDTCHAGSALDQVGLRKSTDESSDAREIVLVAPKIENQLEDIVKEKEKGRASARVIFTSCSPMEKSLSEDKFQHGLFTHFLMQGLSGAHNPDKTEISIEELISWTKNRVIEFCKEKSRKENRNFNQTPGAKTDITCVFKLPIKKTSKPQQSAQLPDMTQSMKQAAEFIKANRFDDARSTLKQILLADSLHWEAMKMLQSVGEAEESFDKKTQEEFRKTFEEWMKRGNEFLKEGKIKEAEECFDHAEKIFPADDRLEGYREQIEAKKNVKGGTLLEQLKSLFIKVESLKEQGKYAQVLQLYDHILTINLKNAKVPKEKPEVLKLYLEFKLKQFIEDKISTIESRNKQRIEWLKETTRMYEDYISVGMEEESHEVKTRMDKLQQELGPQEKELASLRNFQKEQVNKKNTVQSDVFNLFLKSLAENSEKDVFLEQAIENVGFVTDFSSDEEGFTNSLGMKFKYIPPGTFMMGSPADEDGRFDNEIQHSVTLTNGFYMQTTQVTQGQWKAITGKNPSHFKNCGDNCPVEMVSWNDVKSFIQQLNQKEGTDRYRLPTEAEWEYSARAGSQEARYGDLDRIGWFSGNSGSTTHPVMEKQPNKYGLFDMIGNVWEWCEDCYGEYSGSVTNPTGAPAGSYRVLRGGCWDYEALYCRSAYRYDFDPSCRSEDYGFRLACSVGHQGVQKGKKRDK